MGLRFNKKIKANASDEVKNDLTSLHDVFHKIVGFAVQKINTNINQFFISFLMRGFKIFIYIGIFFGIYALSMFLVDESKSFIIEKEINYPIDKVFPQFNNLQNFTQWNDFL
jgi:hypothetical protein